MLFLPSIDFVQSLSLVGAFLQLVVYFFMQIGKLSTETLKFQIPTTIGSCIMVVVAVVENQYGFFIMEFCWAIASLLGLVRTIKLQYQYK